VGLAGIFELIIFVSFGTFVVNPDERPSNGLSEAMNRQVIPANFGKKLKKVVLFNGKCYN
jgi:hypothetical protein